MSFTHENSGLKFLEREQARIEQEGERQEKLESVKASIQKAEIKIETFPYTKYALHGETTQVSSDAINDKKRGLI